jgi:hypothetical protein
MRLYRYNEFINESEDNESVAPIVHDLLVDLSDDGFRIGVEEFNLSYGSGFRIYIGQFTISSGLFSFDEIKQSLKHLMGYLSDKYQISKYAMVDLFNQATGFRVKEFYLNMFQMDFEKDIYNPWLLEKPGMAVCQEFNPHEKYINSIKFEFILHPLDKLTNDVHESSSYQDLSDDELKELCVYIDDVLISLRDDGLSASVGCTESPHNRIDSGFASDPNNPQKPLIGIEINNQWTQSNQSVDPFMYADIKNEVAHITSYMMENGFILKSVSAKINGVLFSNPIKGILFGYMQAKVKLNGNASIDYKHALNWIYFGFEPA